MKVLVGHFTTESNEHIPNKNTLANYEIAFGQECINRMKIEEVFKRNNIDIIPSIYAGGGPSGVIEKETFLTIENYILDSIKKHIHEIDGIYMWIHGASYVDDIGSGDFHIVMQIRKLVGPYLPIAISCDPHGNLCQEYINNVNIIRSFRESPHTDMVETYQRVAQMLCDVLKDRENIHPQYLKLPLILGGEQSVSADEPVLSINKYMNEMEKDERIRSVSWHVGYLRHDCPEAGCGVVVIPQKESDSEYCKQKVQELYDFVWQRHHQFHYTGITASPDDSLQMAIECKTKPFVITDSGDNTTSGASGWNTFVLRQVLENKTKKSFLFASICDPNAVTELLNKPIGNVIDIDLGVGHDELSQKVNLKIKIKNFGEVVRVAALGLNEYTKMGDSVLVHIEDTNIDVVITNHRQSYCHQIQFEKVGINNWRDYDVVVVKQGYIFPELKDNCAGYVMDLTDGPTPQNTKDIDFKLIKRPMYPIDEI